MPTFITYASYSNAGVKGMVSEPTDRTAAIKGLIEKSGGKLIAAYMTTGTNDIVIISNLRMAQMLLLVKSLRRRVVTVFLPQKFRPDRDDFPQQLLP